MKYFTNLFVFLAWYLEKISDINATSITQEEQIQKLKLNETWRSDFISAHMIALKTNILLLTSTSAFIIHSENAIRILKIEGINIDNPTSIAKAPDGAFDVPSLTVSGIEKISQLDVSDPMRPRIGSVLANSPISIYLCHVWINKTEFLAGSNEKLSLFENKNEGEAKEWNEKRVTHGEFHDVVVYQYDPNSFVVYTSSTKQIQLIWPEDADGKPGDWQNENHIKNSYIECNPRFITTADVNNDGKTDLLVSTQLEKKIDGEMKSYFEVRAYEIPEEFKNPNKYTEHVLISSVTPNWPCIKHLKTFTPFTSYKGKPWILVSHSKCGEASYLQPESQEVGNWNYKSIKFFSNDREVHGIEVADINQDGYTELYILADRLYVYSFSTPSSSSIFYLDSTLLMFIWLFI